MHHSEAKKNSREGAQPAEPRYSRLQCSSISIPTFKDAPQSMLILYILLAYGEINDDNDDDDDDDDDDVVCNESIARRTATFTVAADRRVICAQT